MEDLKIYKYGILHLNSKCYVGPQIGSEPHFSFGNMRRPPNNGLSSLPEFGGGVGVGPTVITSMPSFFLKLSLARMDFFTGRVMRAM